MQEIPLNQITPSPTNPRTVFDEQELNELITSIKSKGVLQPVLVRPRGKAYELIAGERRVRASLRAGLTTIPAVVREASDAEVLELQIIENVQRADMSALDEAASYQRLQSELGFTQAEVARRVGKSSSHISTMMRILALPSEAKDAINTGLITRSVAYHIARLPQELQLRATRELAKPEWSDDPISEPAAKSHLKKMIMSEGQKKRHIKPSNGSKATNGFTPKSNDYIQNWRAYLVKFSSNQFISWRTIVNGRTEINVLAEAVESVMLDSKQIREVGK